MEYRSIYSPDNQWAVLHSLWDKDQTAFGEYMLFILQPQFDFSTQIPRVFPISSKKCYDFVKRVCMSSNYGLLRPFPVPDALYIEGPFYDLVIQIYQPSVATSGYLCSITPVRREFQIRFCPGDDIFPIFRFRYFL